jgi:SAM-dependent methyltransferase
MEKRTIPNKLETWLLHFACPECKGDLRLEASSLICNKCKRNFQINLGIPILLPDALKNIHPSEKDDWLQLHTQLEEKYIDLDGDSFCQKMLETAKKRHYSDTRNSFFWEKRLFGNLREHTAQRKGFFRSLQERNQLMICKLRERFHLGNKIVLNLGPGADADLINCLENEGAEVMNCDLIRDSLQYLSDNGKELLTTGDIRSLPFQPRTFDIVLAVDVLHHVHPLSVPLKEIYRVLRKEGVVCINELNRFNLLTLGIKILPRFVRKLQRKLLRRVLKTDFRPSLSSPYERILSRNEVTKALEEIGFLGIEASVLNYVNPVFPRVLIDFFEPIASRFPRVFAPIACRYFFAAEK